MLDDKGISRFALLQDALSAGRRQQAGLLRLRPALSRRLGPHRRAARQAQGAAGAAAGRACQRPLGDPVQRPCRRRRAALYERASEMGLEGIVSKRADAPYQSGRSKTWIKTKALQTGDFVIAGYTISEAAGRAGGAGARRMGRWRTDYRGKVGTGFDAATLPAAAGAARAAARRARRRSTARRRT